jgi:hypothetical protein
MRLDRHGGLLVRLKRRHRNAHEGQRISRRITVLEMDTRWDAQTGAWADLLLRSLGFGLLLKPHTSSALDEVPDLVGPDEASSDRHGLGRKCAVDHTCFFCCKDLPDFGRVQRDIIGFFGQLLCLPAACRIGAALCRDLALLIIDKECLASKDIPMSFVGIDQPRVSRQHAA